MSLLDHLGKDRHAVVCYVCGHGTQAGETLLPDGTCPYVAPARAANAQAALERALLTQIDREDHRPAPAGWRS